MSDPYRAAAFRCPTCADSLLRELESRLVCDDCHGLMIGETELAAASALLGGEAIHLDLKHAHPTTSACPRCLRPLVACRVELDQSRMTADVLRCEDDGIWLPSGQLARVLAALPS